MARHPPPHSLIACYLAGIADLAHVGQHRLRVLCQTRAHEHNARAHRQGKAQPAQISACTSQVTHAGRSTELQLVRAAICGDGRAWSTGPLTSLVAPLAGEACETGCLAGCRAALGTVVVTLDFSSWCRRRAVRRRRAIAGGMRAQCRAAGERGVPARHRGCGCSHRVAGLAARLGKGRGRPHLVFFLGVDYDREDERRDRQRERELLEPASGQRRQGRGAHTTRTGHTASTTRYDRGAEQTPAQARSWTPRAAHARAPAHAVSSAPRPPCPPPSRSAAGLPPHFVAPTWRSVVVLLHGVDEHPVRKMSRTVKFVHHAEYAHTRSSATVGGAARGGHGGDGRPRRRIAVDWRDGQARLCGGRGVPNRLSVRALRGHAGVWRGGAKKRDFDTPSPLSARPRSSSPQVPSLGAGCRAAGGPRPPGTRARPPSVCVCCAALCAPRALTRGRGAPRPIRSWSSAGCTATWRRWRPLRPWRRRRAAAARPSRSSSTGAADARDGGQATVFLCVWCHCVRLIVCVRV